MPVFEVAARSEKASAAPKKRLSPARRRWYAVLRYLSDVYIVGGLFALTLILVHSQLVFILLPTGLSLILARAQLTNRRLILLATLVTLAFYAGITGFELLTHSGTTSKIILVTTTLAIAVIFDPLRQYVQTALEQRFALRDDATKKAVAAFFAALREEIDLAAIRERILDILQQTLRPQSVAVWVRSATPESPEGSAEVAAAPMGTIAIAATDPFAGYALEHPGIVEIEQLHLDSPTLRRFKADEVELVLPLTSQGELLGLLTLGPRLVGVRRIGVLPPPLLFGLLGFFLAGDVFGFFRSGATRYRQEYTRDDRALLDSLAAQIAPALRVATMVRAQQAQVRERERIAQELRTARQIQQTFLPKEVPSLPGWRLTPYYHPAREVGGDFYDFLPFEDGCLGLVIGDVTGKGIPAALVMTAARTMLRTAAQEQLSPAAVLARVNELLCADIPAGMFVTCFYARLDPATGRLRFANAGQDFPLVRTADGAVRDMRATGMPLGLMPERCYDEGETALLPGDRLIFFSDGVVEAHNSAHEMFGLERVSTLIREQGDETPPIDGLLRALAEFTEPEWEQEDDITLVALERLWREEGDGDAMKSDASRQRARKRTSNAGDTAQPIDDMPPAEAPVWRVLDEWTLASEPGNERQAIRRVATAVRGLRLSPQRLERLKTAVGEATMNAMEHGNHYAPELPVVLQVCASADAVAVRITDEGGQAPIPTTEAPDLDAKLAGLQSARGWGMFLIEHLVDAVRLGGDETHHTVELVMRLEGEEEGGA